MKYNQLSEEARKQAIKTAFDIVQEKMIDYSYEKQIMGDIAKNYLFEFHCDNEELDWEYEYGRVDFPITKLNFNLEKILSDNEHLLEVWKHIVEVGTENSEIEVEVAGMFPVASFKDDYEWEDLEEKLEYMKKYAAEYGINVDKYEVQLMFGADIEQFGELQAEFEQILRKNGLKVANYVLKKASEMVGKIRVGIEGHIKYLKSEEYVKEYLEKNNHIFEFNKSGESFIEKDSTENN
ncbi:hypothetical protein [Bacillus toyonensis]|uniref:hypothetical protein n=1 Tax=Bacillus toyonensis TaxID=155322 RepID=UPI002E24ED97|nr:hypothetical protein [Bacillus toyonensis]